jgi:hypothetical protein
MWTERAKCAGFVGGGQVGEVSASIGLNGAEWRRRKICGFEGEDRPGGAERGTINECGAQRHQVHPNKSYAWKDEAVSWQRGASLRYGDRGGRGRGDLAGDREASRQDQLTIGNDFVCQEVRQSGASDRREGSGASRTVGPAAM